MGVLKSEILPERHTLGTFTTIVGLIFYMSNGNIRIGHANRLTRARIPVGFSFQQLKDQARLLQLVSRQV
jgi:hypothetical protein